MYKHCQTAKGNDGKTIKVGDTVECLSYHTKDKLGAKVLVVDMWKQGLDGTIIRTNPAPDPEYPHHFSHRASLAIKI